ncbi:MAG: hypothetical protein FWH02_07980 [Oscillospiraceae bacterium]|nr:hypothetical protein [Oscillospiraceae bacterium]
MCRLYHKLCSFILVAALVVSIALSAAASTDYWDYRSYHDLPNSVDLRRDVTSDYNTLRFELDYSREQIKDDGIYADVIYSGVTTELLRSVYISGTNLIIEFDAGFTNDTPTPFSFSVSLWERLEDDNGRRSRSQRIDGTSRTFRGTYMNRIGTAADTGTGTAASSSSSSSSSAAAGSSPVNRAQAVELARQAARSGGVVRLQNATELTLSTMRAMVTEAGRTQLRVNADSTIGRAVDVRIAFDPANATTGLDLSATTEGASAKAVADFYGRWYRNRFSVISFGQKGGFGMRVAISAKLNPDLNKDALVFYSYDREANQQRLMRNVDYRVDANGYVRFNTSVSGDIIITDRALMKR